MTQLTLAQVADSIPRYQELIASGADMRALDETLTVNTFFRPIPRFSRYLVSGEPERICIYDTKRGRYSAQQLNPHDKYWQVGLLGDDGKWKTRKVQSVWREAWHPDAPENSVCNHLDSDRTRNGLRNLDVVTQRENTRHAWANGRCEKTRATARLRSTKLTKADVRSIFELRGEGWTLDAIGNALGCSGRHVSNILRGGYIETPRSADGHCLDLLAERYAARVGAVR